MKQQRGIRWALGTVVAIAGFVTFTVAGWAGDPQFGTIESSLAPAPAVTGGGDVLYTVTYPYTGRATLTHSVVEITFPAGWTFAAPAAPNVCVQATSTTVRCDRGSIGSGDPPVVQAVRFTTPEALAATPREVKSILTFKESGSDQNKSHVDSVDAPAATVNVVPPSDNHVSKCAAKGGATVGTKSGISETNGLTTTINVPPTTGLCSPVSAQEFPPQDPAVTACPTCTTEVSVTATPLFSAANPIELVFEIYGKPKTWFKNGVPVPACTGPGATPDPCISQRSNIGKGLRLKVLTSGNDPSWEGG